MADTKISALSAATALAGTEVIPIVQGGATVKATPVQLAAYTNFVMESTNVLAQRNGTAAQSKLVYNTYTDASNYERSFMRYVSNVLEIGHEAAGTGTAARDLVIKTGGTTRMTFSGTAINVVSSINCSSTFLLSGAASILGYLTGAGGSVTQTTSRTTGVTINKSTGQITLVSAAGSTSWQSFTVTNSQIAANSSLIVTQQSGTDKYMIHVTNTASGSFQITFATTGGTTTEQPVFNFSLIRGAPS